MELATLLKQVKLVRKCQKSYYACKLPFSSIEKQGLLYEAQRQEKALDSMVLEIENNANTKQLKLV